MAVEQQQTTDRPAQPSLRARVVWTLSNLLILGGIYLLLFAGGVQADIAYNRMAARGDNNLPAPRAVSVPVAGSPLAQVAPSEPGGAAFTVPVLDTNGAIRSGIPTDTAQPAGSTVSRIQIPRIAVDSKVIEVGWDVHVQENGAEVAVWQVAEYAVGHHKGSANPGDGSNVVLAGHVGGYGLVFRDLYYVQPGDEILLHSEGQQYLYIIQERLVLDEVGMPPEQQAANARYIEPTDTEMVTLVTCWPASGPERFHQRIIVRALPYDSGPLAPHERWRVR